MLNGIVGFQLIDDGTPISLGLILLSAAALFIGTGYIALDTAFKYSGHFNSSMDDPNRNVGLYVLYQLAPLVFLVGFFILETILVLNVLGEKKPMRMFLVPSSGVFDANAIPYSVPPGLGSTLCHRTNLPICHQHAYLLWDKWQDQRSTL